MSPHLLVLFDFQRSKVGLWKYLGRDPMTETPLFWITSLNIAICQVCMYIHDPFLLLNWAFVKMISRKKPLFSDRRDQGDRQRRKMTAPGDANSLVVLNLRPGNYFLLRWYIFIWYHFFDISKVLWKKDYEFEICVYIIKRKIIAALIWRLSVSIQRKIARAVQLMSLLN